MAKVYEYNYMRENWYPLEYQKEKLKRFWGERLLDIRLNKEDKRYITCTVLR